MTIQRTKNHPSRYDDQRMVTRIDNHTYTIEGKCAFMRCSADEDGLVFFDPDGGPFIHVGYHYPEFDEKTVVKIIYPEPQPPEGWFKFIVKVDRSDATDILNKRIRELEMDLFEARDECRIMEEERDEARRIACKIEAHFNGFTVDNPRSHDPKDIAKMRGWDLLFKEETK